MPPNITPAQASIAEDIDTLRQIDAGDANAYRNIVSKYFGRIRGFIVSRTSPSAHKADELAQEVFVVAWNRLHTFDRERDLWVWLAGIAHNVVRRHWRDLKSRKGQREAAYERIDEKLFDTPDPKSEAIHSLPYLKQLKQCINKLAGRTRDLVVARYLEEKKVKDIASKHQMTPNSVSAILFRSKAVLRECLEKEMSHAG
ncbi:MAG: RNA polymerase sigma factor [Opitutales bacterium]